MHARSDLARQSGVRARRRSAGAHRSLPDPGPAHRKYTCDASHDNVRNWNKAPEFALVSAEGSLLQKLTLEQVDDEEFAAPVTLPNGSFRVAAMGIDAAGLPYQRMHAGMFHAELVELSAANSPETIAAGSTTPIAILVRNHGPTNRFRIVAADSRGKVNRVEPQEVDVPQGAEATVNVWMAVPADAAVGTSIDLTVTAESAGAPSTVNSVIRQVTIAASR